MAKQLNVNLAFTADTSKAKAQLQDLQNSLTQLMFNASRTNSSGFGLTKDLTQAVSKVAELQSMLESAKTSAGTLDLGKLNLSMQKNNATIADYARTLSSLGTQGEQAFAKLAQSITTAEVPLRRSSSLLAQFATTLKNTARWQVSSSILHGFMGSVQSAYGYAQDLNESLNNIRIVTGQSTEQMAEFAEKANKAARALSATTTEYTNASLIYYQQGLSDQEVQERTDVTIQMAHASGQSAEIVSDQLTAVWNNFYDGSKSLEHYANVMTALGAATASSSDEIAGGLEKFASIADMIGLSYEYAASALATITATTRQSEDVVGTALKTIFARIQGLNLGETLDDGTTLNKYSEALEKVGISIFEQNGELKNMDAILNEMGTKWDTLAKDQQIALAQTVAGVRQYNQLVSLMDNWDFFEQNLEIAQGSEGALKEQADIYAESWEAARDRVTAAAQDIYDSILDDDFFIALTNGFGKFLNVVGNTVDALGGLPGVLSLASVLLFKMFGSDMTAAIERWGYNIKLRSKEGLEEIINLRKKSNAELRQMFADNANDGPVNQTKGDVYTKQANLQDTLLIKQQQLVSSGTKLTEEEQKQAQLLLDINNQLGQSAIKAAENLEAQMKTSEQLEQQYQVQLKAAQKKGILGEGDTSYLTQQLKSVKELQTQYGLLSNVSSKLKKSDNFSDSVQILKNLSKAAKDTGIDFSALDSIFEGIAKGTINDMETLHNSVETVMIDIGATAQINFDKIGDAAERAGIDMKEFTPILQKMKASFSATGQLTAEQIQILKDYGLSIDEATEKIKNMEGQTPTVAQGMVTLGQTLSNVAMTVTSIKGLFDTWNNEDMTFGEKLISTFTTLGMVIPMVTMAFNKQNLAQLATVSSSIVAALGFSGEAQAAVAAGTATAGFGATLWTVLWPIGLVIAAIGALVGVISLLANAYNADANASKKAQEELKTANQALDDAKQKYQEVADAIKTYEESVDTLSKIRRGTEEWDEAVKSLNADVLDLIKSYSGLAQYVTNEDGVLTISQEGLDWLEETQAKNVRTAEINSYNAQVRANKAENRSETTDLSREITAQVSAGDSAYDAFDRNTTEQVLNAIAENGNTIFADTKDSSAQDSLANALYGAGFDELTYAQQAVVDASIENSDKLMQLAADIEANSQANRILTEQIANSALADNSKYNAAGDDAQNAVDQIVANALENVDDSTWSKTYLDSDGTAMNDKEIQAEYAKLMGWDTTNIGNKSGFGEYNLADGTTYKVDDTTARYALNQQKKLEELTGAGGTSDAAIQDFAELSADALDVDNMKEYLEYREDYYKIAQDTYNLTDEQVEKLLQESTAVGELAKSYDIASEMAAKFNGEENPDDKYYEEMAKAMEGLSDEELTIALDVLADSATLEEFQTKFEQACTEAMINSWNVSAETMKTVMDEGSKEGKFSDENMTALESDDGFIESLKEQGISFKEFQLQTFDEQYAMVLRYYQDVSAASAEAYETQKSYLTQEKLDKEAQLNALRSAQKEYNQLILDGKDAQAEELAEEFEDTWDIEITADITQAESELDSINSKLEELEDKHIEVAIDWDGIDEIENGMKQTAEFTKLLKNETKKVGNSYQMTAAQAKDWMQIYPELFENATVTTDGLISLDESYVNEFIDGKEAMSEASIEQKLLDLEAEEARLLAEKDSLQAEFDAVKAVKEGEMKAEQLSAEQLSDLHSRLTQYYIDLGYDEAEAHAQALNDMGLDEETYSKLVANAAEINAKNQAKAAKEGADAQAQALSGLAGLWQKFINGLKKAAQAVKRALTGEEVNQTFGSISPSVSVDDGSFSGYSMTEAFTGTDKSDILEAFDKGSFDSALDGITLDMSEIDAALASIKNQRTYLEALKNQDLSDYGSTDPDDVDGTKGGKDKEKEEETLTEILERYHEINEEVETYERLLDRISKKKDRAFGGKRLALIEDEIDATEKLYEKEKQLYEAQTAFLAYDQLAVQKEFANAQFDEYGNISNYTDLLKEANNALNQARTTFNGSSQGDADKKALEDAEKEYERLVEILEQYEETLKAWYEQEDRLIDLRNQIQDLNYEKLSYKLELEVIINDNELKELDYYFNKMEGDIEKAVEAFGLLKDKMEVTKDSLADYEDHVTDLEAAYAAGDISQADYIDGLQSCYDGLYENLEALNELDEQMMEYYGETYDLALEKIEKYTSQLEHLNGVLDHYKSIMSLLGKDTDFETMGVILEGQVETTKNSYEAAQSVYNMAKEQKEAAYQELQNAKTDEERELLQKNYDKAVEEFNNAQEEMLSCAEAYGQAIKDVLVNSMEQAAKEMEEAMTGVWGSFEALQEQMKLHSKREDEFLTTTNKLYETNKMLNQLAQDMEKTDNRIAKSKYAAFAKEIEQLQQKGKLSNLELEIAKAKYSMLQAQIALEEANNAKSTVRLQRDSEGNFGYVYTADQDKIASAEQDLADAENDLYNIRLEAANEYGEKMIQARADLQNRLKEIDEKAANDAAYREGQYAADRQRILDEYYATIETYSELYGIATCEDARVVEDAWTSTYSEVINDGGQWKDAVTQYTADVTGAFETWQSRTDILTGLVGEDLDETKNKVDEVTSASDALKDELIEEVVPAVSTTLTNVRTLTAAYASQRTEVLDLAKAYEDLAASIRKKIQAEAQEVIANTQTEDPTPPSTPNVTEELPKTEEQTGNELETASITTQKGVAYAVWNGAWGNGAARKAALNDKFGDGAYETYQAIVNQHDIAAKAKNGSWELDLWGKYTTNGSPYEKLRSQYGPSAFLTGGYTGEWGLDGKLAILHEKELVLNAEDTENMLRTVSLVRQIVNAIDLQANWASTGMGLLSAVGYGGTDNVLEQTVTIHAEFPNATDHNEIEEAFNTLINRAAQYANRK